MAGVFLAGLLAVSNAWAAPKVARIHYAEAIGLPGIPAPAAAGSRKPGSLHTGFDAFGRRFDLRLESNDRLLHKLSSANRQSLPAHALYAGTVAGRPGSWVRITRLTDGLHGLVYDGDELYVLAPAGQVESEFDAPLPGVARSATVVFRAADTDGGLGADFCRILEPPGVPGASNPTHPQPAYKALFAELQSLAPQIAAATPTRELDLALVGDSALAAQFANPTGEMLARLNNIDGIFSAQVGVKVVSGFLQVLASDGGLTSTTADVLLDQFESYRKVTPEAASRGLAHLMTGRELDGSTIGIAYMGTLCQPQFDVSLSQTYLDTFYSSMVAAHEIGHNFGAPHDGTSGSACASTPQTYLMSPSINGSQIFSQCSLDQMTPVVSAATCLAALPDVAVEFPDNPVSAYTRQDLHLALNVVSYGPAVADSVSLRLLSDSAALAIVDAKVAGHTCTADPDGWSCSLGSMASGAKLSVDVTVRGQLVGDQRLYGTATTARDANHANDTSSWTVHFDSAANGSITLAPTAVNGYVGDTRSVAATISNPGPASMDNTFVVIPASPYYVVGTAGGTGTTCDVQPTGTRCSLGSVPAGTTRRVDVTLTGTLPADDSVAWRLESTTDDDVSNNLATLGFRFAPRVELLLGAIQSSTLIPLGGTSTDTITLWSIGPDPVVGARLDVTASGTAEVSSVAGAGAVCALLTGTTTYRCTYDQSFAPNEQRNVNVRLRGVANGSADLLVVAFAPDNQHIPGTNSDSLTLHYIVRGDTDVRITAATNPTTPDHQPITLEYVIDSSGASPADNSRLNVSLPAGVRATAAQAATGSCSIASTGVACVFGTLAAGSATSARVTVVADVPGNYALPAQATADSDKNAANGEATTTLTVRPNVDVSVAVTPATLRTRLGDAFEQTIALTAATQPLTSTSVAISAGSLTILQATPSQGSCQPVAPSFNCTLGALAAGHTATVLVRLRGDNLGSAALSATGSTPGDVNPANDFASGQVLIDRHGDVSMQADAPSVSTTIGTPFSVPRVLVNALAPSDDVRVEVLVPAAFSVDSATAENAPCAVNAGSISCTFGRLEAGQSRAISLRLRSNQAGTFSISASASAVEDTDTSNNSTSIAVTVNRAASGGGGSGGGGGSLDPAVFLLMLFAPALARRRRPGAT